jgi:hypothetical protein
MFDAGSPTPPTHLRFSGVWDMQDLYEAISNWFRMRKYEFHERSYKHKHPSPFGVERQYVWEAIRRETEYVLVHYDVYMHEYDSYDLEVTMKDGSKKVFTKGRLWAEIKVQIRFDHEKRWNESPFYYQLKDFYNKYVLRKRFMQGWSPKFRTETFALQALMRERLKMEHQSYAHRYYGGSVHRKAL